MNEQQLKLAIIYDPECPKLTECAYSSTYRDMLIAVTNRFATVPILTDSCWLKDIKLAVDVILIYDIHSSHHLEIEGLASQPALKYTYFNDPHQVEFQGQYRGGPKVHKLGARQRVQRAMDRGIDYIICPYKNGYYEHIASHLFNADEKLFWFPPAPSIKRFPDRARPLAERRPKILGNGILHPVMENGPYEFRNWAFAQKETFYIRHAIERPEVPSGDDYGSLLSTFAGALALCDWYVVPKYLEIPLAGGVCFAQDQQDYRDMGFVDGENCIFVTKENYQNLARDFLASPTDPTWQTIADAGRKLIEEKWTAERFADALYEHAQNHINQTRKDT